MIHSELGLYIHIPFCIRRCHYCDFVTYSEDQIRTNQNYVDHLILEIQKRRGLFKQDELTTIYFGGGTPSLLSGEQVHQIIKEIKKGFKFRKDIEITLEANPKTLDQKKCLELKSAGVNRISLGCQTFNDDFLKACNREHSSQDSLESVDFIKQHFKNYSLDLLFSLPEQTLTQLEKDLEILKNISPPHISAYYLTLKQGHPMDQGRCSEEEQIEMFSLIFKYFHSMELKHYEISNFSKPGFQSRHNNLYWTNQDYWGLGLSAHSYRKDHDFGFRFWNFSNYKKYLKQVEELQSQSCVEKSFKKGQFERLKPHESLTDFCCSGLRLKKGISPLLVRDQFGAKAERLFLEKARKQIQLNNMEEKGGFYRLSKKGFIISNLVFASFLFSEAEFG